MDKEAACEKQQAPGHMEGDGDAVSCSTDTSRWSPPSSLSRSSESPQYSSDCEDKAGLLINRTPDALPSVKWKGSKQSTERSREKDKKAREAHKQNQNHPILKLPPIKPLQGLTPKLQPDSLISIRELKNQVCDVEQQLKEARTENKLLKRLQHRHTVALQYFQDSEDSISQILKRHNNEVRGLQRLLSETRNSRDNLARQLQATENKLLNTKASLQHLQLLSQNHSLLQREDLTLRLAEVTAQLEMKDKRILYLQKNFELCQASFKRQIVAEKREIAEERKLTCHLQEQIHQLNKKSQDREKELEKHNIYSQRFLKGPFKKGWKNKIVQTDGLVFIPSDVGRLLEIASSDTEERLEQQESSVECMDSSSTGCSIPVQTESLVIENPERRVSTKVTLEENHQKDTVVHAGPFFRCHATETPGKSRDVHFADTREDSNGSEESPEHQNHGDCAKEKEASKAPQVFEEKQEAQHESTVAYILEECLNSTKPERKHYKCPKIRRKYIFKQSTEDLHNGRPVSSGVDMTSYESTKSTKKVEILSSGIHDLHLSGEKSKRAGVDSSQWELTAAQEDSSSEVSELVTYSS